MKKNLYPQLLIVAFTAFLVWSCAPDPHIESARLALAQGDFEEVIAAAQEAIDADPENANAYYYMGVAYASIASNNPPEERLEDYERAREYLEQARQMYAEQGISNDEAENLPEVIFELWAFEHNSGIQPLTDDIISSHEDSLILARHHFQNAIAINPDSSQSYSLLAEVYFAKGDMQEAERLTRTIIYDLDDADLFNYYRLALYLMEDDRDAEAVDILYEAREIYPDEIEITQEIANAYLRLGRTDEALEVVRELMEQDPENPQYRLVYATQIYQMVQELDDQIRSLHDDVYDISAEIRERARSQEIDEAEMNAMSQEIEDKLAQADELIEESFRFSDEAEEQLLIALESEPENPDIHSTLGIVYQNRAAIYQDKRNMSEDVDEAEEFDAMARKYLERALPHYEKAAELEPDDQEHWMSLFRVYTNLGMNEKAEHARERAGF
ncbi:tetratricopeptide repeat protein [Balneolales bacterium ANBcel1]|nr:tetratricopeptide repeat protein [Balneolales bacterium ANBcel1]